MNCISVVSRMRVMVPPNNYRGGPIKLSLELMFSSYLLFHIYHILLKPRLFCVFNIVKIHETDCFHMKIPIITRMRHFLDELLMYYKEGLRTINIATLVMVDNEGVFHHGAYKILA
jgi:hypothetical protein